MDPTPHHLTADYWSDRYTTDDFPWDLGAPSQPLIHFCSRLAEKNSKDCRILIPGGGRGHDVHWLWQNGFTNVVQADYSKAAHRQVLEQYPELPKSRLITEDFFNLQGPFDLILEQTFLHALLPRQRPDYARQMANLLAPGGLLAGVLFNFPLSEKGPPFGGEPEDYRALFAEQFDILKLEPCYNSMPGREGKELFFICRPKDS